MSIYRTELLAAKAAGNRAVRIVDAAVGDAEPSDEKQRADYVAAASNFYQDILEKKMLQMIAQTREELDTAFVADIPKGMIRKDYDNFLRGTSNAFKGEHLSNIKPNEE